jgi:hypothetical protein
VSAYGSQSMSGALERVLVRPPLPSDTGHVERYGWRGVPDPAAAAAEHEELRAVLAGAGAEVIVSEHDPGNPDAIYVYDPVLVGDDGAVGSVPASRRRAFRSGRSSTHRPRPRAATPSGSTTTRCSSATATAPARPGSPPCGRRFRVSR